MLGVVAAGCEKQQAVARLPQSLEKALWGLFSHAVKVLMRYKKYFHHFGKYNYSISCREFDDKIETTQTAAG